MDAQKYLIIKVSKYFGFISILKGIPGHYGSGAFAEKSDMVNWPLWPLGATYEYNLLWILDK